jgi:hypothetical protein
MIDLCLRGCPSFACPGESVAIEVKLFHFKFLQHLAELVQQPSVHIAIALVTYFVYQIEIP